jgi:hypothetical protein
MIAEGSLERRARWVSIIESVCAYMLVHRGDKQRDPEIQSGWGLRVAVEPGVAQDGMQTASSEMTSSEKSRIGKFGGSVDGSIYLEVPLTCWEAAC